MKRILDIIQHKTLILLAGAFFSVFYSCNSIYENENKDECATEYRVRFKYDYNMKFANAFANEVKTVTLYAFDDSGRFVYQRTEEGDLLKDDNYSMRMDVEPGQYNLVAWAGLDDQSFAVPLLTPGESTMDDLTVKTNRQTSRSATGSSLVPHKLAPLWHGESTKVLTRSASKEVITIPLIKNTNSIRIVLQQMDGLKVDASVFDFAIVDDNGWMNYDNTLLKDDTLTYTPYYKAQGSTDGGLSRADGSDTQISVAVAQITTARLMADKKPRLIIINRETERQVLSIPLVDYLLLTEQEGRDIDAQEYLDRQDEYSLTFFLDRNMNWMNAQIIINGWTIRLNDLDGK